MGLRGRLERLGRRAEHSCTAQQNAWLAEAVERLSNRELRLLADALRREQDLESEHFRS